MGTLTQSQVTCMLPVKDLARARRFYEQQLGLEPVGAKPDGKFVYRCGGTEVALFPKAEGTKAQHTALSFQVADIGRAIADLKGRGVRFADYDLPGPEDDRARVRAGFREGGLVRGPGRQHPVPARGHRLSRRRQR